MNKFVKAAVEERVAKLENLTEYNSRQIEFLAARIEEYKAHYIRDISELIDLKAILYDEEAGNKVVAPCGCDDPMLPSGAHVEGCAEYKPSDAKASGVPQHTNVIVG